MKSFVVLPLLLVAVAVALPANSPVGRVSDGLDAWQDVAPYVCSVRWGITNRSHSCGATLLTANWVLSTAHCFTMGSGSMDIQCGVTNRVADIHQEQVREISDAEVIFHPGWTGSIYSDDVVLIRVNTPFDINNVNVGTIPLRQEGATYHGDVGRLFGWGARDGNQSTGPQVHLQTAEMDIYGADECRVRMTEIAGAGMANFITDSDICAGRGTYSVCGGDSGSPLISEVDGTDIMVGMAVWGLTPCGRADAPSVFVRTSAYTNWIESTIGERISI